MSLALSSSHAPPSLSLSDLTLVVSLTSLSLSLSLWRLVSVLFALLPEEQGAAEITMVARNGRIGGAAESEVALLAFL